MNNFFILLIINILLCVPLQDVYDSAMPANGYDKYIVLDQNIIYEGGIGIYEGTVFINCSGAIIDLEQGNGIWIYSDEYVSSSLDIRNCSIINGEYYGISYSGNSTGNIINCNFINNDIGIKLYDTSSTYVTNTNFIENMTYALGIYSTTPTVLLDYCNFWNNDSGDLMENCPN